MTAIGRIVRGGSPALLHVYAELGVNDRAAAVAEGFQRGLLVPRRR